MTGLYQDQRPETPGFEDARVDQAAREQSEHDQLDCHADRDRITGKGAQRHAHAGDPLRPGRAERRCPDDAQTMTGRPPPHGRDVVEQKTARQYRQHGRGGQPAQARLTRQARSQAVEQRNPDEYARISRCDRPDPASTRERRFVQVGADEGRQVCGVELGWWAVGGHVRSKTSSRRPGRPGLIVLLDLCRVAGQSGIGAKTRSGRQILPRSRRWIIAWGAIGIGNASGTHRARAASRHRAQSRSSRAWRGPATDSTRAATPGRRRRPWWGWSRNAHAGDGRTGPAPARGPGVSRRVCQMVRRPYRLRRDDAGACDHSAGTRPAWTCFAIMSRPTCGKSRGGGRPSFRRTWRPVCWHGVAAGITIATTGSSATPAEPAVNGIDFRGACPRSCFQADFSETAPCTNRSTSSAISLPARPCATS